MTPRALITGITGQDGWYLAEQLMAKGYEVHGLRRSSSKRPVPDGVEVIVGDVTDYVSLLSAYGKSNPDVVFNLAADSFVPESYKAPNACHMINAIGVLNMLTVLRGRPDARFIQASSSEMFGDAPGPQNELTPFMPRTPYGIAKTTAHFMCAQHRAGHNLNISVAIMFNHESPRRDPRFLTQKAVRAAVAIENGSTEKMPVGDLTAHRDWGDARDYMDAMIRIAEHGEATDFIVATGVIHNVEWILKTIFKWCGLDYMDHIQIDRKLIRPPEPNILQGDASKLRAATGWQPATSLMATLTSMVEAERERYATTNP